MPKKTETIKTFLTLKTHSDLANLYHYGMECQVNVAQDGGDREEGNYEGRMWHGWTDGLTTWKSFRVPFNARKDPTYTDTEMRFDIAEHAEGIGMTGWDWEERKSIWVAFDFDAMIGHSDKHTKKLNDQELKQVRDAACDIEWVTVRKSTSGNGLHLYVFLDGVDTQNHNEHAALGRAILAQMSALSGYDFESKVDICGGNMWVWHRKMEGTDGLTMIKQGGSLSEAPRNWKDHIRVTAGRNRRTMQQDSIEGLSNQYPHVPFDTEHKKIIEFLQTGNYLWWWDQDAHMLVTHTKALAAAHEELNLNGFYTTDSKGTNMDEQNCFCFPMRGGIWSVRRFSQGASEHDSWDQDGDGWTRCFLNKEPDLRTACRAKGGLEDPKGGFIFQTAEQAADAARLLGSTMDVDIAYLSRAAKLSMHKDGRLIMSIKHEAADMADKMSGWLPKKDQWTKISNIKVSKPVDQEIGNHDDLVRHLVTIQDEDCGWVIKREDTWGFEPVSNVRLALSSLGVPSKESSVILGSAVIRPWKMVNKPFQPEYPGNREWNRDGAQMRFAPSDSEHGLHYPNWTKVLQHCGSGLDSAIKNHPWAKANGILTGSDYLRCWISSLFQEPMEPLPYLFLWSEEQNTGKSTFHEALDLLLTKGYNRADAAMTSQVGFNKELEGALVCVVEEINLNKDKQAYNRMKDWVTSRKILIHPKGETPYHVPNSTHWIQCSNEYRACPVFPGDTRVTMINIPILEPIDLVPQKQFFALLRKEAPDFLASILKIELPESNDRLNVPVINTSDKMMIQSLNMTSLEAFIHDNCDHIAGYGIKFSDFYETFLACIETNDIPNWSKNKVGRQMPPKYAKGRYRKTGHFWIGNIKWKEESKEAIQLSKHFITVRDSYLECRL